MSTETSSEPTVFTRIVNREIPATIVHETANVLAFQDIDPKAPVHVLVIPKTQEYANVVELAAGDPGLLAEMIDVANHVANDPELMGAYPLGQFRLIFNTGEAAGQTVFHVHAHVMAGKLQEGSLA